MLLALLACLPAAASHAKVDYAPDAIVLGKPNALTYVTVAATVASALLGWCLAGLGVRQPGFLRTWRGRLTLLLLAALGVASWRLSAVTSGVSDDWAAFGAYTLLRCCAFIAAALVLGHAAGLARRSPRWWWITEAAALLLVAGLATALGWNLGEGGWSIARIAIGLGILSLLAASIVAFRVDVTTAPTAHWRTLRIGITATLAIVALAGTRLRTMGPRSLAVNRVIAAPAGSWVNVWGYARWPLRFEPGYLLDIESGRWLRLGVTRSAGCSYEPAVAWLSADGGLGVWSPTSDNTERPRAIFVADLGSPPPRPRRLDCVRLDAWAGFVMSPSGRWLLIPEARRDVLVDVAADRIAVKFETPERGWPRISRLDDSGHLDVALGSVDRRLRPLGCVEFYSADAANPTLRLRAVAEPPAFAFPPQVGWMRFVGSKILIDWSGEGDRAKLALHDARDGALVAIIAESDAGFRRNDVMSLSDDRLVRIALRDGFMSLAVYSADGAFERSIPVASAAASLVLTGEYSPARIVVGVSEHSETRVMLVDVDRGEVLSDLPGLECLGPLLPDTDCAMHGPATRVFRETNELDGSHGALVELDWTTGARRVVLP